MSTTSTSATPTNRTNDQVEPDELAAWLLCAVVLAMPLVTSWILWAAPGGADEFNRRVTAGVFDLPAIALIAVTLARIRREGWSWPRSPLGIVAGITLGWAAVTFVVHPSWRGVDWFVHVAGAAAIVFTIRRMRDPQLRLVLSAIVALAVVQGLFGAAQSAAGRVLGAGPLEYTGDLYPFGTDWAGAGSFDHPYHLTAFLTVGLGCALLHWVRFPTHLRRANAVAMTALGFAIPFTYSRASLLGLAPLICFGLATSKHRLRIAVAALMLGLVVGASATTSGWIDRASTSTKVDQIDRGRAERAREAKSLLDDQPIFGVGPGNYVVELEKRIPDADLPAHNVVFQAGAEAGYVGLVLAAATLLVLGWWAVTGGPLTAMLVLTLLPFHLLDSFPHLYPRGILISGIWIGCAVVARDRHRSAPEDPA